MELYKDGSRTFYFWGSKPGVAEIAKQKMKEKYPNIKIVGVDDGYFDDTKKAEIIERIKNVKPNNAVFLCLFISGKNTKSNDAGSAANKYPPKRFGL